jgi:hypothetical protein
MMTIVSKQKNGWLKERKKMNKVSRNTVAYLERPAETLLQAHIDRVGEGRAPFELTDENGVRRYAWKAFSCLVEPAQGDLVLLAPPTVHAVAGEPGWILAILHRSGENETVLDFDRPVRLSSKQKISLVSSTAIESLSDGSVNIAGNTLSVKAVRVEGHAEDSVWTSQRMASHFRQLSMVAESCTSVFRSLAQHLDTYTRRVDTIETLQAGALHHAVKGTVTVYSKDTVMTAEHQVKIKADVVHLS